MGSLMVLRARRVIVVVTAARFDLADDDVIDDWRHCPTMKPRAVAEAQDTHRPLTFLRQEVFVSGKCPFI
uniref:Secreted protein n=1 Tax=Ascaris lumbricoides TaxID=6252 RepID=A0A0M3IV64_ASCLU